MSTTMVKIRIPASVPVTGPDAAWAPGLLFRALWDMQSAQLAFPSSAIPRVSPARAPPAAKAARTRLRASDARRLSGNGNGHAAAGVVLSRLRLKLRASETACPPASSPSPWHETGEEYATRCCSRLGYFLPREMLILHAQPSTDRATSTSSSSPRASPSFNARPRGIGGGKCQEGMSGRGEQIEDDYLPFSARAATRHRAVSRLTGGKKELKEKANEKKQGSAHKITQDDNMAHSDETISASELKRNKKGQLVFEDHPEFRPNMSPEEVLRAGSFGGTYFRPIYSSITKQHYKDVYKELPQNWLQGLDIHKQVSSATYREQVNTYKVKCGGSLEMWESSGWIKPQDPYGWFQWYCRFYQGRRTEDDVRQISRWANCTGVKGRWRNNLITKVVRSGRRFDDPSVSPVVRQTLQHWGYRLTEEDYREGAKRVKPK
ncbi:uncharacterized protein [Salminus brasiliensis]|uniref:uncharacterized protein n=1 Tax=Salminus brasiliensis TaxID=930266 RepID=UPI003B832555